MSWRQNWNAGDRCKRDLIWLMGSYFVVVSCVKWLLKHHPEMHWLLYAAGVLPAVPIIGVIARLGRYLREESDEYQKQLAIKAILVGTAALLSSLAINDFVRAFDGRDVFPPFTSFVLFLAGMFVARQVQKVKDKVGGDA